jgi:hypothetical protein
MRVFVHTLQILHFTFGTAKPWMWWTYPFLPYVDMWVHTYQQLAPAGGSLTAASSHSHLLQLLDTLLTACAPALALLLLAKLLRGSALLRRAASAAAAAAAARTVPAFVLRSSSLAGAYACFGCGTVLLLLCAAVASVAAGGSASAGPGTPVQTCIVAYTWALTAFAAAAGCALHLAYLKGAQLQRAATVATAAAAAAGSRAQGDTVLLLKGEPAAAAAQRARRTQPQSLLPLTAAPRGRSYSSGGGSSSSSSSRRCSAWCGSADSPLRETVAHMCALALQLALLLCCGHLRGLQQLPLSGLIRTGVPLILLLLVYAMWSFARLPQLWSLYGAAAAKRSTTSSSSSTATAASVSTAATAAGGSISSSGSAAAARASRRAA